MGLVGCGVVGRGLVALLDEKRAFLKERFGFEFEVRFISDYARGTLVSPQGIDLAAVLEHLESSGNIHAMPGARKEPVPLAELLRESPVDVVCDATPTNYETGEPSKGILEAALSSGASAITCSKGGVGLDLAGLKKLASERGAELRYESSVLSGTPLINLVRSAIAGCEVEKVEGIVNGTTNYILTRMESGMDYAEALYEAQRLGYAETDPTGDVEGFDAAVKVCIMAQEFFGVHLGIADVDRRGITAVTADDVTKAKAEGKRIKLIAGVRRDGSSVSGYVEPRAVELSHPLAGVMNAVNAACITTDNLGDITIVGPGAGARETAQGFLADMLDIARGRERR